MEGRETELDKTLLEAVRDPLTHLVRNSVDHGIESPEARRAAGKPAEGVLVLRAFHEGGQVDHRDHRRRRRHRPRTARASKAVERRGCTRRSVRSALSDREDDPAADLPARVLHRRGGHQRLRPRRRHGRGQDQHREASAAPSRCESAPGRGTTCGSRIPLTLAIVPALTVECAGDRYAIPQVSLLELVRLDAEQAATAVEDVHGAPVYRLRGGCCPWSDLTDVLGLPERHDGHVVIAVLQAEDRRFGLVVDRSQTPRRSSSSRSAASSRRSACTPAPPILGDGTVALILDVQALARRALRTDARAAGLASTAPPRTTDGARPSAQRMLLAAHRRRPAGRHPARHRHPPRAGPRRLGREGRQPRGRAVPRRDPADRPARPAPAAPTARPTARCSRSSSTPTTAAASRIVVEEILDIVDGEAAVRSDIDDLGLLGSAVLGDKVTELLDVARTITTFAPALLAPAS